MSSVIWSLWLRAPLSLNCTERTFSEENHRVTQEKLGKLKFSSNSCEESMSMAPDSETTLQKFVQKCKSEPLVPLGSIMTVGCLVGGIRAFQQGNKVNAQYAMRARVLAQGFTVVVVCMGAFAGFQPHDRPKTYEEKLAQDLNNKKV